MRVRRLAVLGHPVAHSRSPAMQNAALAALGLGEEWSYEAIDLTPGDFEERMRAMAAADFAGANVTVPHKQLALARADSASVAAEEIGAANTLTFADGEIRADNTDAGGLIAALPNPGEVQRALVLGAGGAARAAIWALRVEGALVDIWNRTGTRAEAVNLDLGGAVGRGRPRPKHNAERQGSVVEKPDQRAYDLIVNTTVIGLGGEDPFEHLPLEAGAFAAGQTVVDMVYGERPSTLLAAAGAGGATTVDGIEILVQQGALSLRIWTDLEPPLDVMRAAARS